MGKYEDLLLQHNKLEKDYQVAQAEIVRLNAERETIEKDIASRLENEVISRLTSIQEDLNLSAKKDAEITDLRKKMREDGAGLLGTTMELDALKDKLKDKEQELAALSEKISGLTTGGTGILGQLDDCVQIMKQKMAVGKHNIRIVVPSLTDFDQLGFAELLPKLPPKVQVNIAADFDLEKDKELVVQLQQQRVTLTRYPSKNEFALNVDNAACVIGIVSKDDPTTLMGGMFTNVEGLISLFVDAIQTAWVKGFKVPIIQPSVLPAREKKSSEDSPSDEE
jgi:hypothetical protein